MSASSTLDMKTCSKCGEEPPLQAFSRSSRASDGLQAWCKECQRAWLEENRETRRAQQRRWYYNQRHSDPAGFRHRTRLRKYGLSSEEYEAVLTAQASCCAACGDPLGDGHEAHIDHDHVTGRVRGILCRYCNVALGQLKDDVERVRALLRYVESA